MTTNGLDLDAVGREAESRRVPITMGGQTYLLKNEYDISARDSVKLIALANALETTEIETDVDGWLDSIGNLAAAMFLDDISGVDWDKLGLVKIRMLFDFFQQIAPAES